MKQVNMGPTLQSYIDQLRARTEELRRREKSGNAADKLGAGIQRGRRIKPLDAQITELMQTLPPQVRNRPWSMAELVSRLTGKYRDRPHPQQVGQALRRLNWRRERRWEHGYDGVRLWVPNEEVT